MRHPRLHPRRRDGSAPSRKRNFEQADGPFPKSNDVEGMNPAKAAASRLSEGLDFSAPDRVDDARFNQILWLMMKGDRPMPAAQSRASLHLLQISR
jgi:hypothetical protein